MLYTEAVNVKPVKIFTYKKTKYSPTGLLYTPMTIKIEKTF